MQSGSLTYEQFFFWLQGYLDSKKRNTKEIQTKMEQVRLPYEWVWTWPWPKQQYAPNTYTQPYTWCSTTVTLPSGSL